MNDLILIPLGSVSTYCYNDKNCPGFLVKYDVYNILLDAGNGISRYLDLPNDLENMSIFISHLHSDHYGELLSLAQTSYVFHKLGYLKNRVKVYIPKCDSFDYLFLTRENEESYLEFISYEESDHFMFDDLNVSFCRNPHPVITYSTKLENSKVKLVYSSDTGFEKNCLESFAKNANMLICETTFLKGQNKSVDNHLYAYEAGIIARNANVDKLLLMHFWPSIDKSEYVDEASEYFNNVEAACENKKYVLRRS